MLERAFQRTYGIALPSLFLDEDLSLGTYRYSVSTVLPKLTKAAWDLNKKDIIAAQPGITKRKFIYNVSRASYRKSWNDRYRRADIGARLLAFVLSLIPKVGPFRTLAVPHPTAATETMFMRSFNDALTRYRDALREQGRGTLRLSNQTSTQAQSWPRPPTNSPTRPTRSSWVAFRILRRQPSRVMSWLTYADLSLAFETRNNRGAWRKLIQEVDALKQEQQP